MYNKSNEAQIILEYVRNGKSQQEIAKEYGMSQGDVSNIIRDNGLNREIRGAYQSGSSRGAFPNTSIDDIRKYIYMYRRSGILLEDFFKDNFRDNFVNNRHRQDKINKRSYNRASEAEEVPKNKTKNSSISTIHFTAIIVSLFILFVIYQSRYHILEFVFSILPLLVLLLIGYGAIKVIFGRSGGSSKPSAYNYYYILIFGVFLVIGGINGINMGYGGTGLIVALIGGFLVYKFFS